MKNSAQALLGLALFGALCAAPFSSCQSSSQNDKPSTPARECKCGTEDHDMLGCPAACSTGKTECENPLCTCEHTPGAAATANKSTTTQPSSK